MNQALDALEAAINNAGNYLGDWISGHRNLCYAPASHPIQMTLSFIEDAQAIIEGITCCDCGGTGILWPRRPNDDDSHGWIERCDECHIYESDDTAAFALAEKLGATLCFDKIPGLAGFRPYIDIKRA